MRSNVPGVHVPDAVLEQLCKAPKKHGFYEKQERAMTEKRRKTAGRRGRAARVAVRAEAQLDRENVIRPGITSEAYKPLTERELERINDSALHILESIGMGDASPEIIELARQHGLKTTDTGRIKFPRAFVEDMIAGAGRNFTLFGRSPEFDLEISGSKVYYGTAGAAVMVPDPKTGAYRPSTLIDLYDFARLADRLPNIHFFGRTVVPTELPGGALSDINVTYAVASGTQKHVGVGFTSGRGVDNAVKMFDELLGGEGRFAARPCCTIYCTAIVPPLRYGELSLEVAIAAARAGMPVDLIVAAQAGATAPAALAGALVQTTAETLGGVAMVNLVKKGHPTIFSNWPLTSDLRTGAFAGGGPEGALLNAASAQIANFYDLPSGVACSMTDSKIPDNQTGYEKGITSLLTGLSGANMIHESAGMQASLLGCCFEAMAIDSEMLGTVLRVLRGIEVNDETLSVEMIKEVVGGPGHYLGHDQTLGLMETEYIYPVLGDRLQPTLWEELGSKDIRTRAKETVQEVLSTHYPSYIPPEIDEKIRKNFDIQLRPEDMKPGNDRW
jgi:trimethylamine--corrinoid protein Co-methyltransferase